MCPESDRQSDAFSGCDFEIDLGEDGLGTNGAGAAPYENRLCELQPSGTGCCKAAGADIRGCSCCRAY